MSKFKSEGNKAFPVFSTKDGETIKQLQSKIAALSIAVADNDIDEVKRLLPLSGEQVVRDVREESSRDFLDWLVDEIPEGKKVWPYEIQNKWIEYIHTQLRNPEQ